MRTVKLKGLSPELKKVASNPIRATPEGMPTIDNGGFLCGCQASRGSGKTTAIIKMCQLYDATKTFDKCYLFSPSYYSDPKYQLLNDMDMDLKVYDDFTNEDFKDTTDEIKSDINEYRQYEEYKKVYEEWNRFNGDIMSFPPKKLVLLYSHDFRNPNTLDIYKRFSNGVPRSLMIFDDLAYNNNLYSNVSRGKNDPKKFFILHRHQLTSVIFITQTFKTGLPKQLRNNLSCCMLFSNKAENIKKDIALEMSSYISPDKFIELWDYACKERYCFFMCDYDAKNTDYRFRKNFNELLIQDAEN